MSDHVSVEAPYVLASLPKPLPLDGSTGHIYTSVVKSYKAPKWRRRPEIVVGIDGEGINIYNIRDSRLITSYALSPQSRFVCPPCSIYRRSATGVTRYTYAVVAEGLMGPANIVCFLDEHNDNKGAAGDLLGPVHSKHTYTPLDVKSQVIDLTAISGDESEASQWQPSLCVTHANGTLECLDYDLTHSQWQVPEQDTANHVDYVTFCDVDSAKRGLLKSRPDALALLDRLLGDESTASRHSLLVLITSQRFANSPLARQLRCFALPSRSSNGVSTAFRRPLQVVSYALPGAPPQHGHVQYHLQSLRGVLFQLLPGYLTTWDLSQTLPFELSTIPNTARDFCSHAILSSSVVAVCTASTCKLFDVTHCSQQAIQDIRTLDAIKERRSSGPSTDINGPSPRIVSYFSELGLLTALRGNKLIALRVNIKSSRRRDLVSGTPLASAFGKGLPDIPKGQVAHESGRPESQQSVAWTEWKKTVDQLADDGNVEQLERFLAADVGVTRGERKKTKTHDAQVDEPGEEDTPMAIESSNDEQTLGEKKFWNFGNDCSSLISKTKARKARHCLRKLFVLDTETPDRCELSVALYAQEILTWLALTGFLKASVVQEAFVEEQPQLAVSISKGSLTRAFVVLDPTFGVVHDFLNLGIQVDPEEVVQALKSVIQSLESPLLTETSPQKLLTNGIDRAEASGDVESEATLADESEAAEADLAFAMASLNDGLAVRSGVLGVIFARLVTFPTCVITRLIRTQLSEQEVVFLITLLRIELADGGWTVRYQDESEETDGSVSESFSNRSIDVIAKLLNIAIDAVGTSGWLVGLSGDTTMSTDEMLLVLRAETTAALEGCYEAEILQTHLNDFERYTRQLNEPGTRSKKRKHEDEDAMLPLGFKVDVIETTTVSKGGKVRQKSKNAIGKELSMKVGQYTIDRIKA